jgi:hypothetical protein
MTRIKRLGLAIGASITTFWQREGDTYRPRAAEHGPNLHRYCHSGARSSRGCHPHDASPRAPGLLLNRFRRNIALTYRLKASHAVRFQPYNV